MTTRVMVANFGGHDGKVVHIHIEYRGEHGQFARADTLVLEPGEFRETYVHDGAQLAVHEADAAAAIAEPPAPVDPEPAAS